MKSIYKILPFAAFTFAALFSATSAQAQSVHKAVGESHPIISRDEGGFNRCGVKVVVRDNLGDKSDLYDVMISVLPDAFTGVIEGGKLRATNAQFDANKLPKPAGPAPVKFWIAKDIDSTPLTPTKYLKSREPGAILAAVPFIETFSTIINVGSGERMQLVMRYPEEAGADRVIAFTTPMARDEAESLNACLQSLESRMKAAMEQSSASKRK